ncbi:MAG: hypothetical protein WC438_00065 [Candidatus Pacearchaeota archaeon]
MKEIIKKHSKPKFSKRQRFIIVGLILNILVYILLVFSKNPVWLKFAFDGTLIILSIDKIKSIWFRKENIDIGVENK